MIWKTSSTSSADTERLGELLGSKLSGGEVIELRSDLGGGKTTFVKGLVRGSGSQDTVVSPTFTLSRIYDAENFQIHHFDFYRLNEPGILADQLAESVRNNRVVVVVEWAQIVQDVLPDDRLSIELRPVANNTEEREIIVRYPNHMSRIITEIETDRRELKP